MKMCNSVDLAKTELVNGPASTVGRAYAAPLAGRRKRRLLLLSNDAGFHQALRRAADGVGQAVVQFTGGADALRLLAAVKPVAVLLDLDLPSGAAWEMADTLLQQPDCPAMLLLTSRSEQFDVRTAVRAGSLFEKSAGPQRLLELVEQAVAAPVSVQTERNAIQRVAIRWLRPSSWCVPLTPAYRFWGINE